MCKPFCCNANNYTIEIREKESNKVIAQLSLWADSEEEIIKKAKKAILKPEVEKLTSIINNQGQPVSF